MIESNVLYRSECYMPNTFDCYCCIDISIIIIIIIIIGAMGSSCTSLFSLLNDLGFDKTTQKRIIMKTMNVSIRSSYFIFCQRNKPWTNPERLTN